MNILIRNNSTWFNLVFHFFSTYAGHVCSAPCCLLWIYDEKKGPSHAPPAGVVPRRDPDKSPNIAKLYPILRFDSPSNFKSRDKPSLKSILHTADSSVISFPTKILDIFTRGNFENQLVINFQNLNSKMQNRKKKKMNLIVLVY